MWRWLFLFFLLFSVVGLFFFKRPTIETSLFALVGEEEIKMHPEVLTRGSREIQVVFVAKDVLATQMVAEAFYQSVLSIGQERCNALVKKTGGLDATSPFETIRFKLDDKVSQDILNFYKTYSTGLLASDDKSLLLEGKTARLRQQALRHWHTSPTSLYALDEDPFHLLEHFVCSRPLMMSGWKAELNGFLSTTTVTGEYAILLSLSLKEHLATNPDALIPIVDALKAAVDQHRTESVEISISGVPLHTVEVAGKCKQEIFWLSLFSIVVILVTAWVALKSLRVYPYMLFVLLLSGAVGTGMTLLCCSSIHVLAGVFATTLLGLTIDYAFHG
ncbi:MAG: MMPL family transporter, partial [bacterium]|nr:MMPL family transporter [bacterium]